MFRKVLCILLLVVGAYSQYTQPPPACNSSPCVNGATCVDSTICYPFHSNRTGFISTVPLGGANSVAALQGYAVCTSEDGRYFAVMGPQEGAFNQYGVIRIYKKSVSMTIPEATIQILPTGTVGWSPPLNLNCQFNPNGTAVIFSWHYVQANCPTADVKYAFTTSGLGVVNSTGNGVWSTVPRFFIGLNASTSDSGSQPVHVGMAREMGFLYLCRPNAYSGAGYCNIFIQTGYYNWAEWSGGQVITNSSNTFQGRFGSCIMAHRSRPIFMVGAPQDIGGNGCVYNMTFDPVLGTLTGNDTCTPPPISLTAITQTARFGLLCDASDDLLSYACITPKYGIPTTTSGGTVYCSSRNGPVACIGPLVPPLIVGAYKFAISNPVGYAAWIQLDTTGQFWCQSDSSTSGNGTTTSGAVWCTGYNPLTQSYELVGGVITTPQFGQPGTQAFGRSLAFSKDLTIADPILVIGAPQGSGVTTGGFVVLSNGNTSCLNITKPIFNCQCTGSYSGTTCQTFDSCASNPCQNGGSCVNVGDGGLMCSCSTGYSGPLCQTDINECASAPCAPGLTCIDGINTFACVATVSSDGVISLNSTSTDYSSAVVQFTGTNSSSSCTLEVGTAMTLDVAGLRYTISDSNQCLSVIRGTQHARLRFMTGVTRIRANSNLHIADSVTVQTAGSSQVVLETGSRVLIDTGSTLDLSGSSSIISGATISGGGGLNVDGVTIGPNMPNLRDLYGNIDPTQLIINSSDPSWTPVQFNNFTWEGDILLLNTSVLLNFTYAYIPNNTTVSLICNSNSQDRIAGNIILGSGAQLIITGTALCAGVYGGDFLTITGSTDMTSSLLLQGSNANFDVDGSSLMTLSHINVLSSGSSGFTGSELDLIPPVVIPDSTLVQGITVVCPPGYSGFSCAEVNECASGPCPLGATCVDGINAYACLYPGGGTPCRYMTCTPGYSGFMCEIRDPCYFTPCSGGATCTRVDSQTRTCACSGGLTYCDGAGCFDLNTDVNHCGSCTAPFCDGTCTGGGCGAGGSL